MAFPEAASTKQKDLHKELSAFRVDLENITIAAPGSNVSQVQWKVRADQFVTFDAVRVFVVDGVCCVVPVVPSSSLFPASLTTWMALRFSIAPCCPPAPTGPQRRWRCPLSSVRWGPSREGSSTSSKFVLTGATCTGERATLSTLGCQKQVMNGSFVWRKLCLKR